MLRLDHVVVPIWDVEQSIAFYRDLLGLRLIDAGAGEDWGGYRWLLLQFALADKRRLVLVRLAGAKRPAPDRLPKDARHIAMAETGSLGPWRDRLRAAGVPFWEEDHGAQHSLYFEDPNGVTLEITSPPAATELAHNERAVLRALNWLKENRA